MSFAIRRANDTPGRYPLNRRAHAGRTRSGGLSLNVFTDDEFADIHLATLEVLEQTGVFTDDPESLDIFEAGGASVDRETGIVRIPAHIVEAAIASAPERVFAAGRDSKDDIMLDAGRVGFTTFGEGLKVTDLETGELRDSTKQDVADTARLADYLDELDTYELAVGAHDVPASDGDHPQLRSRRVQHHEARLRRSALQVGDGGDPRHRRRRCGRA